MYSQVLLPTLCIPTVKKILRKILSGSPSNPPCPIKYHITVSTTITYHSLKCSSIHSLIKMLSMLKKIYGYQYYMHKTMRTKEKDKSFSLINFHKHSNCLSWTSLTTCSSSTFQRPPASLNDRCKCK